MEEWKKGIARKANKKKKKAGKSRINSLEPGMRIKLAGAYPPLVLESVP